MPAPTGVQVLSGPTRTEIPRLILVGGMPGSGKSHFATALCKAYPGSAYLDKDTLSGNFCDALLPLLGSARYDRHTAAYLTFFRDLEYKTLLEVALENIHLGRSVICSAPFVKEFTGANSELLEVMQSMPGVAVKKIWLTVSSGVAFERIKARSALRDTWKISNWAKYLDSTRPTTPPPSNNLLVLDNDAFHPEENISEALRFIAADTPGIANLPQD